MTWVSDSAEGFSFCLISNTGIQLIQLSMTRACAGRAAWGKEAADGETGTAETDTAWLCHRHSYVFFGLFIPVGMSGEGMREIGGSRHSHDRRRKGMKPIHYMSRQKD